MIKQEKIAIHAVIKYEERHGRKAVDCSDQRCVYDIKSLGRLIEVKSSLKDKVSFIILQGTIFSKLTAKQRKMFYLYYVELRGDKPVITIIKPKVLFKNLIKDIKYRLPASIIGQQKKI